MTATEIPGIWACAECNMAASDYVPGSPEFVDGPTDFLCKKCGSAEIRFHPGFDPSEKQEPELRPARLLYLSSPMDKAHDHTTTRLWRSASYDAANYLGWSIYDPSSAFRVPKRVEPHYGVQQIHFQALLHSDAMLALLPEGAYTIGVPMEIQFALERAIPVAVVGAGHSWALAGTDAYQATDVEDAYGWLEGITPREERNEAKIQVKVDVEGCMPTRSYEGDAGYDLYCSEDVTIAPGEYRDVPLGISMAVPEGYWARIVGRSSTFRNRWLDIRESVMDAGYRGPWFVGTHNVGPGTTTVKRGERLAQVVIHRVPVVALEEASELPPSERGSKGFGSSGL